MPKFKKIDRALDKAELVCIKTDGTKYEFNPFVLPLTFTEKIHNHEITLDEAMEEQTELKILISKLNNDYNPKIPEKKQREKLCGVRDEIINLFEKGIFLCKDNVFKTKVKKSEEESEEESEENKLERIKNDYKKFIKDIEDESKSITMNCSKDILIL